MITEYYYQNVIISAFSQKGSLYFMNNCQKSALDAATETSLHNKFMKEAIRQARKAAKLNEVPIGCVITYEDRIIARGYNRRNTDKSTLAHAEIAAIKKASKVIGDWRLEECTLYVTLEPCQMCAGAIVQARIPRVVIGTMNAKAGCAGSVYNLLQEPKFNHQVDVIYDVLREECTQMLTSFFIQLRQKHKEAKQKAAQELQ
jgi:tRNA(adenine34) deaminase